MTEVARPPLRPRASPWRAATPSLQTWLQASIVAAMIAVLALQLTVPVTDGDLFWQLKYAEQMLARGTLVPDHTLYSWTPTTNDTIYCAWIGELVLYGLYQLGGLPLLFALRYLCLAAVAAALMRFAGARGVLARPTAALIIFLSLIASLGGTLIKPEMFSLVLMHALVLAYCLARARDREGGNSQPAFLAIPAIVLVWVNTHGGFMLAAPFFAATFAGELSTRWFAPAQAFSRRGLRAMLIAWALAALAVFVTPYGWRYPAQLVVEYLLRTGPRPAEAWNNAYQSIVSWPGLSDTFDALLLAAAALAALTILAGRRLARADWGLLIALALYTWPGLAIGRATFYLAAVFGYAALDVLAAGDRAAEPRAALIKWPARRTIDAAAMLLALAASLRMLFATDQADAKAWLGFGIGYINPVVEAEYLAAARLPPRFYNIYDSGGYLLWRLDPQYKVMIDPRYFPYKDWFDDLYRFSIGESFAEFLDKYPAEVALIDLDRVPVWKNFLQSKDWRLAFYGPVSALFVRNSIGDDRLPVNFAPDRLDHLRNGAIALHVFDFAVVVGDYPAAWNVLAQIETGLRHEVKADARARASALHEGYRLIAAGDYDGARPQFATAGARPVQGWREPVILKLLEDRATARKQADAAAIGRYEAALHELAIPMPR